MSWNYRLIRMGEGDNAILEMTEVYYDEQGAPNGWSSVPARVAGDTKEDVMFVIDKMTKAVEKPILVEVDKKLVEEPNEG